MVTRGEVGAIAEMDSEFGWGAWNEQGVQCTSCLFLIYCTANLRQAEEFFTLRIFSFILSQLLMGNAQDFLFLAKSGTPFSASSYSNISALFENHFSVKLTTKDLRKCVVDYFLSLPASGNHVLCYVFLHSERWSARLGMRLRKQDMCCIFMIHYISFFFHISLYQ